MLNKQREVIYTDRHLALGDGNLREKTLGMLRQEFTPPDGPIPAGPPRRRLETPRG